MAKVERFEDLRIWQEARILCQEVYDISNRESFARDFALKNQIRASSGSVMDNIAEGFERGGNKEFINFLGIAKGSSGEVRSQLYRAVDQRYVNVETFERMKMRAEKISGGITNFIVYLKGSDFKGLKFKEALVTYNTNH